MKKVNIGLRKGALNLDVASDHKANYERGGGYQLDKPIFSNCGRKFLGSVYPVLVDAMDVGRMIAG